MSAYDCVGNYKCVSFLFIKEKIMYEVEIVQKDGKYLILNTNYGRKTCYSKDEVIAHLKKLQAKYGEVKFYYDNDQPRVVTEMTVCNGPLYRDTHKISSVKDFVDALTNKDKDTVLSVIMQIWNYANDNKTIFTKELKKVLIMSSKIDSHIRFGKLHHRKHSMFSDIKTI